MKFSVTVTLKNMGIRNLNQIRQGKFFEIDIDEKDSVKAENEVKIMCQKLLANQIIEDFQIKKI